MILLKNSRFNSIFFAILSCIIVFLLSFNINSGCYFAPLCFLLYLVSFCLTQEFNDINIGKVIISLGFVFNLSFVLNTKITDVQYDFLSCYNYIEYILENNLLFYKENPLLTRPSYSTYHPILSFFISALFLKFGELANISRNISNEFLQIIGCIYMLIYYITSSKILRFFGFNSICYYSLLLFICCFPTYNAIAGFINNDTLLLALQALVIYFSLLYYRDGGIKNISFIIIFNLLLQLTKLSGILILGLTGFICIIKLLKNKNKKTLIEVLGLGLGLLVGCLIWPTYQYFVLDIRFDFVPPQEHLTLKGYSIFDRFTPYKALFYDNIFYNDFGINLWETLTKTALFGQWNFYYRARNIMFFVYVMILFYKLIILLCFIAFIYLSIKHHKDIYYWFVCFLIIPLFGGMITFVIKHPFMCNQDFRYIAILPLFLAILCGLTMKYSNKFVLYVFVSLLSLFALISCFVWWFVSW